MSSFQDIFNSEQATALLKDEKKLEALHRAPETQRLFQLLSQSAGGDLEQAANRAVQGDSAALMNAVKQLMQNSEGQQLLQKMKQSLK